MGKTIVKPTTNQSGNGYCKMPDGTLIQWGYVEVTTGTVKPPFGYEGDSTVTFPIPFISNIGLTVVVSPHEQAGYWNATPYQLTTTSFRAFLAGDTANTTKGVEWIAIGRWK